MRYDNKSCSIRIEEEAGIVDYMINWNVHWWLYKFICHKHGSFHKIAIQAATVQRVKWYSTQTENNRNHVAYHQRDCKKTATITSSAVLTRGWGGNIQYPLPTISMPGQGYINVLGSRNLFFKKQNWRTQYRCACLRTLYIPIQASHFVITKESAMKVTSWNIMLRKAMFCLKTKKLFIQDPYNTKERWN